MVSIFVAYSIDSCNRHCHNEHILHTTIASQLNCDTIAIAKTGVGALTSQIVCSLYICPPAFAQFQQKALDLAIEKGYPEIAALLEQVRA